MAPQLSGAPRSQVLSGVAGIVPLAAARVAVPEQARPCRERQRSPGEATVPTGASAGAEVARAGEGGSRPQPPPGHGPRRANVVATGPPRPPVVPWDEPPDPRRPRGGAAPPEGPHRGQPGDDLQQELLSTQHEGRRGRPERSYGPGLMGRV